MRFTIQAMAQADYDTWIAAGRAGESPPPPAPAGARGRRPFGGEHRVQRRPIQAPAGQPFVIRFNNDDGVQHDVAIYNGQTELFNGDVVDAGKSIDYQVPALPGRQYDFLCTIHPTMTGKVVVQ